MAKRTVARLRAPIFVLGQVLTMVLLVLDARREWSAYGFVVLGLLLGALALLPAALVDSAGFRLTALVTQTIGAGVVALALSDTVDKRALWAYALSALVAVVLPAGRPALGRTTALGVLVGLVLTIGGSAPALAWDGGQRPATVCASSAEAAVVLVGQGHRFDPHHVISGVGSEGPQTACLEVLFDPGATGADADDVARRYSADPRVVSVSRAS